MTEDLKAYIVGVIAGVILGWMCTFSFYMELKGDAIKAGAAHYNPTNGNFEYIVNTNK